MKEEQSKKIACELLAKSNAMYESLIGAVRVKEDDRDVWLVYFKAKKRRGVVRVIPDTIVVKVDDITAEAEIFPSL